MLNFGVIQFRSDEDGSLSINVSGSGYMAVKLTVTDQQELQTWLNWHRNKGVTQPPSDALAEQRKKYQAMQGQNLQYPNNYSNQYDYNGMSPGGQSNNYPGNPYPPNKM